MCVESSARRGGERYVTGHCTARSPAFGALRALPGAARRLRPARRAGRSCPMTSLLPPNTAQQDVEDAPVVLHDVADVADTARKLLELASRTSRTTEVHPNDERYAEIAEAVQFAADAAHAAAVLVVEAAARRW